MTPTLVDAGYRVVRPWLRGYAPSQAPSGDDYGAETLGRDVLGLVELLDQGQGVHVVGHDWGALAAYSAAIQEPDRLDTLVTLAIPHPGYWEPAGGDYWRGRHFVGLVQRRAPARFARDDFQGVGKYTSRWSPEWDYGVEELESAKNCFAAPLGPENALGYYRAAAADEDTDWLTAPISTPTWSFAGTSDLLPPEDFSKLPPEAFPAGYQVITLKGGHFMHRESPDAFADALLDILGR